MTVTVGCDPEFVLYDKEKDSIVRTCTVFIPPYYSTPLSTQEDTMGCELRPDYSTKPKEVVTSLRDIITLWRRTHDKHRLTDRYQLAVGAYCTTHPGQSIGGHIHVGRLPDCFLDKRANRYESWTPFSRRLFLGASYLWILEDPDTMWRRRSILHGFYGGLWEHRGLPDAHQTAEIRSPSSDWLAHPRLMELGLSLAQHLGDAECAPDTKKIASLTKQYGELEDHNTFPTWVRSVKDFISDCVPSKILTEIRDFVPELQKRRRKDGTVILKEEEWHGRG